MTNTGQKSQEKKIRAILISQPKPESEKSPYFDLAKKYGVQLDFYPFIRVEGVDAKEFRKQKIDIQQYTAVILTSRHAVDHFFRVCEDMKVKVMQDCKYFCITEAVALYLQKFILYRKRKVFFGSNGTSKGLLDVIAKHKNEKYLLPCSDMGKDNIVSWLKSNKYDFASAVLYRTVCNDIKDNVGKHDYDVIIFFSPSGVKSLFENYPDYSQNGTYIGAFGPTTSKAVTDAGLRLDIKAPMPQAPSMVAALEHYLKELNKI